MAYDRFYNAGESLHTLQFPDDALELINGIGRLHVKDACPTIRQSQKDLQMPTPSQVLVFMHLSVEPGAQTPLHRRIANPDFAC
jgi:hypothetical protein